MVWSMFRIQKAAAINAVSLRVSDGDVIDGYTASLLDKSQEIHATGRAAHHHSFSQSLIAASKRYG
jgi:hypothetical protein